MRVQVLVAAMNQTDHSLLSKLNIRTDAIIGNQCDRNSIEEFDWEGHRIQYLNFAEKGVGLNRNNTLMRADADICLFADDDMIYVDNYEEIVRRAFTTHPNADVIAFNLKEEKNIRYIIRHEEKIGYFNYLRYGTARIAIRLKSVREAGIFFNQCFGGGTEHLHGEDSIFLTECLNKGLKIYALPDTIAELTEERSSTWDIGYGEKYLRDQGALYYVISKRWFKFLCFQDAIRRAHSYGTSWWEAYKLMINRGEK